MTGKSKSIAAAAIVIVAVAAVAYLSRPAPQANPLAGQTLEQVMARVRDCVTIGKDFKAKSAEGSATTEDKRRFDDCGAFIKAAKSYMSGPIIIGRDDGKLKQPN